MIPRVNNSCIDKGKTFYTIFKKKHHDNFIDFYNNYFKNYNYNNNL